MIDLNPQPQPTPKDPKKGDAAAMLQPPHDPKIDAPHDPQIPAHSPDMPVAQKAAAESSEMKAPSAASTGAVKNQTPTPQAHSPAPSTPKDPAPAPLQTGALSQEELDKKAQQEVDEALKELKPTGASALTQEIEKESANTATPAPGSLPAVQKTRVMPSMTPNTSAPVTKPAATTATPPPSTTVPPTQKAAPGSLLSTLKEAVKDDPSSAAPPSSAPHATPGPIPTSRVMPKIPPAGASAPATPAAQNTLAATFKPLPPLSAKKPDTNPVQDTLVQKLKASGSRASAAPAPESVQPDPEKTSRLEALAEKKDSAAPPSPATESAPPSSPQKKGLSNIRTFKTDLQNTIVRQQTSVISAITAEEDRRAKRPKASLADKAAILQKQFLLIFSALLIIGGIGTVVYVFTGTRGVSPEARLAVPSPIFTEQNLGLDVTDADRKTFLQRLDTEKETMRLTLAAVGQIYLYERGLLGAKLLTVQDFFEKIESRFSDAGRRALNPDLFIGIHAFDGNQPFLLLTTNYYESAYTAMLNWESDMQEELAPFFGRVLASDGRTPGNAPPITPQPDTATTTDPEQGATTGGAPPGGSTGGTSGGGATTGSTSGGSTGGASGGTTGSVPDSGTTGGSTGGGTTGGSTGFIPPPPPPPPPPGAWLFGDVAYAQEGGTEQQATSTASSTPEEAEQIFKRYVPEFTGTIIRNYDVRELKDADGNTVLMYGFPFPDTLIITTNQYTFIEAVTRLISERN